MKAFAITAMLASTVALAGCGSTMEQRAATGGLAGAAVGAAIDSSVTGAVVGGVAGAALGAATTPRHDRVDRRQYYDSRAGRYYFYDPSNGRYYWENGAPR